MGEETKLAFPQLGAGGQSSHGGGAVCDDLDMGWVRLRLAVLVAAVALSGCTAFVPEDLQATTTTRVVTSGTTASPSTDGPPTTATSLPAAVTTTLPLATGLAVVVDVVEETGDEPPYSVRFEVPILEGDLDDEVLSAVNRRIGNHVAARTEEFINGLPADAEGESSLVGTSETTVLTDTLLSLRFIETSRLAGSALPASRVFTRLFDLSDGARLLVEDVFAGEDAIGEIAELARVGLLQTYFGGDEEVFAPFSGGVTAERIRAVAFTARTLEVAFDQFQVGPGSIGVPIVELPLEAVALLLRSGPWPEPVN
jgi:hypothetical protein